MLEVRLEVIVVRMSMTYEGVRSIEDEGVKIVIVDCVCTLRDGAY